MLWWFLPALALDLASGARPTLTEQPLVVSRHYHGDLFTFQHRAGRPRAVQDSASSLPSSICLWSSSAAEVIHLPRGRRGGIHAASADFRETAAHIVLAD